MPRLLSLGLGDWEKCGRGDLIRYSWGVSSEKKPLFEGDNKVEKENEQAFMLFLCTSGFRIKSQNTN